MLPNAGAGLKYEGRLVGCDSLEEEGNGLAPPCGIMNHSPGQRLAAWQLKNASR
jgi:hypothetical protein